MRLHMDDEMRRWFSSPRKYCVWIQIITAINSMNIAMPG